MVKLTDKVKDTLAATRHIYLATAAKDGTPNVVPIGAFKLLDDERLLIADVFFLKTYHNIEENPKVAFSYWGDKGGFQIKGTASIHKGDQIFEKNVELAKERYPRFTPKSAILVEITDVFVIKAGAEAGKKIL